VRVDTESRLRALGPSVVELTAGAVYVDTGTETGRFEVRTPVASVHDVGTQFEVRLLDAQLRVRVRAGLVELRDGIRSISARRGTEIILSSSGAVRRPVAVHGEEWQWTARLALPLEMDGTSLAQFLERIAREHGWTVEYRGGPPMALEAQQIVLYGSVAGLTAEGAVAVAVSASGLRHVLDRGTLVILRDEERRSGETKDVR
jgi:hypothetical protein